MKKILSAAFLVFSLNAFSQNLDTVYVRNLTLQAQDWAWVVGKAARTTDSVTVTAIRKIRGVVQLSIPPTWQTSVTVDSLPGSIVVSMYQMVKTSNAGEIVTRYTAITNAIAAKANVAYWLGLVDGAIAEDFTRLRNIGKNVLID